MAEASASNGDKSFSFPTEISDSTRSKLRVIGDTRHPESSSHFEFGLPIGWRQKTVERGASSPARFLEFCRFAATDDSGVEVSVSRALLPRECGAADWLEVESAFRGERVIHRRDRQTVGGRVSDVLTWTKGDNPCLIRSTAIKDGDRVFAIRCQAPESVYEAFAELSLAIVASFHLLHPEGKSFAEEMREHACAVASTAIVRFQCPGAWQPGEMSSKLRSAIDELGLQDPAGIELKSRVEGKWTGTLRVLAFPKHGALLPETLRLWYLKLLRSEGLRFAGTEIIPFSPGGQFESGAAYRPSQPLDDVAYDVPYLIGVFRTCSVLVGVLSPDRRDSHGWWAINMRALEVVRDSLSIVANP